MIKMAFFDTKPYDKESFEKVLPKYPDIEIDYEETNISVKTAVLAKGADAKRISAFCYFFFFTFLYQLLNNKQK